MASAMVAIAGGVATELEKGGGLGLQWGKREAILGKMGEYHYNRWNMSVMAIVATGGATTKLEKRKTASQGFNA